MLVVGLTGGIATGKSTVSKTFKEYNLPLIDADVIAREVVLPDRPAYKAVVENFGSAVPNLLNPDKSLNREALGRHVFGNKDRLKILNGIIHPAVRREIFSQILRAYIKLNLVVILDVPLLFEAGLDIVCGKTITVTCERDIQIKHLLERNKELTLDDAENRINSQMSNRERCLRADIVIDNNGELPDLVSTVHSVIKEIRPGWCFYLVDLFPPFAVLSAVLTVVGRYSINQYKRKKE